MISYYIKQNGQSLQQLPKPVKGCWINIYPPFTQQELQMLCDELDIPLDFFIDSLDLDERSRYEQEDGVQLIVTNIPLQNEVEEANEALYITIPIGMIEVDDYILTISSFKNPVIDYFLHEDVKNFTTSDHSGFALIMFDRTVYYFLNYLKKLNLQRNAYEKELRHSSRNQELFHLLNIQKSLVYFLTSLRDNEMVMLRMKRTDFLKIRADEEKSDFFEDIIIDNSQGKEMAQIYTDILNGTMDAFASIISNNLNTIMKRLTSVTIILMVPTLVASFYGMNVPVLGEHGVYSFPVIIMVSIVLSFLLAWFFMRKRLF